MTLLLTGFLILPALAVPPSEPTDIARSYFHFSLAQMLAFEEKTDEAVEEMRKAIGYDPESSQLRVEFAEMLFSRDPVEALQEARTAVELDEDNPRAHAALGELLYRLNRQDEALKSLLRAVELDGDDYMSHYYAGSIHMAQGSLEDAVGSFDNVIRLRPGSDQLYFLKAHALNRLGRVKEAIDTLEDARKVSAGDFKLLELLGRLYEQDDRIDDAIETYRSIRSEGLADPSELEDVQRRLAQWLYSSQRFDEATELLRQLVEESPADAGLSAMLGFSLTEQGIYDQSAEYLAKALEGLSSEQTPGLRLEVIYHLGRSLDGMGRRDEAAQRFRSLLHAEGQTATPYRNAARVQLALLYQRTRRFEEALELFEKARRIEPDNPRHGIRLAFAYKAAGDPEKALALSRELHENWPKDHDIILSRAQMLADADQTPQAVELVNGLKGTIDEAIFHLSLSQLYASRRQWDDAEEAAREGLGVVPGNEDLHFQLASVFERRGDIEQAEREFKELIERNPEHHSALNYLGYMLADNGIKLEEALGYIRKAVAAEPFNGAYLDSLGWVHFKMGDWELARQYLQKAIRINDDDPTIFEHLGDLYLQLEELERAKESYEASLKFATEEEEIERAQKKLRELSGSEVPKSNNP